MPDPKIQAVMEPPRKPPIVAVGYSDPIHDLGDRIASLTVGEAAELHRYLVRIGIKEA